MNENELSIAYRTLIQACNAAGSRKVYEAVKPQVDAICEAGIKYGVSFDANPTLCWRKEEYNPNPEVVADVAWLLESVLDGAKPLYIHRVSYGRAIYTEDVDKALRFSRKQDAESMKYDIDSSIVLTAAEHIWL